MFSASIDSGLFLILLLIAPILFFFPFKVRAFLFLFVNIFFYIATAPSLISLWGSLIFVFIPYAYVKLMLKRRLSARPLILFIIIMFVYLNGYNWILRPLLVDKWILTLNILGLSYILFRQLDVIMQVAGGRISQVPLITYLNYLFSFWTIMAGPIQRFRQFQQEATKPHPTDLSNHQILRIFHRATAGMLKILLLAMICKKISDSSFAHLSTDGPDIKHLLYIFYLYPVYVYLNFSGYCDVVISLAQWAGFSIPENFNKPYLSRNMIEFWNRWHITLSTWVRDYLYQPLLKFLASGWLRGKINLSQYLSIFATFFLVGIWHGTTINFIFFGLLHGLGMALSMLYRDITKSFLGKARYKLFNKNKAVIFIEWMVCMHFVCFTFLFFEYDVGVMIHSMKDFLGVS